MAKKDNIKIFTTALLVVLLISSIFLAFVYRSEIYQKMQAMDKGAKDAVPDRLIEREEKKETATLPKSETKVDAPQPKQNDLAEIPSFEEMEPDNSNRNQTSVSVTQAAKTKKQKKTESSQVETQTPTEPEIKIEKVPQRATPESLPKQTALTNQTKKKKTKQVVPSVVTTSQQSSKKKTKVVASTPKKNPKPESKSPSLEARIQAIETKLSLQNEKNDKRFTDIETRLDRLEKSLSAP
ncbi:hypothetical protein LPTSP4_10990 [Leptospira ryugenii]|uniref:Uncharacterized protein n=1 Tax=Leptospira ryugenii TaxID=1917863 RepID=A0A2P2DY91_9LEPT|nr:hypothetical protein [Leptospira ryugenii]GBF49583.1 hypothetical protein LPTSP4_10990 [Leptospira ryugenii]